MGEYSTDSLDSHAVSGVAHASAQAHAHAHANNPEVPEELNGRQLARRLVFMAVFIALVAPRRSAHCPGSAPSATGSRRSTRG
jgi:hypothetical protein